MLIPRINAEQIKAYPDQTADIINRLIDWVNEHSDDTNN